MELIRERVSLQFEDGIAQVKLARSEKMNALDLDMFKALVEVGNELKDQKSLRAVVMSGEGKAFCSGLDIMSIQSSGGVDALFERYGDANLVQYVATIWRDIPVPVIAALHGAVFGGGFQISLGADIRYARADAKFSIMEMKWGLVPDMAGNLFMRELASSDVIRELIYTSRVFSGEDALKMGFVTKICDDPASQALLLAKEISLKNPDAIRAAKRLANAATRMPRSELLSAEEKEQRSLIQTPNQIEAVMANWEKREPRFVDPV